MKRRLSAILVADVVGYSSLMEADEEGTAARLAACRAAIDSKVAACGGRVFQAMGAAVLAGITVAEDWIIRALEDGQAVGVHVPDAAAAGSVIYFYHANGTLWRAVRVEGLNPGWVMSTYHFRGDLAKFDARLARLRCRPARPTDTSKRAHFVGDGQLARSSGVHEPGDGVADAGVATQSPGPAPGGQGNG